MILPIANCVSAEVNPVAYALEVSLDLRKISSHVSAEYEARAISFRGQYEGHSLDETVKVRRTGFNYTFEPEGDAYKGRSWYRFVNSDRLNKQADVVLSFLDGKEAATLQLNLKSHFLGDFGWASFDCALENADSVVARLKYGTW